MLVELTVLGLCMVGGATLFVRRRTRANPDRVRYYRIVPDYTRPASGPPRTQPPIPPPIFGPDNDNAQDGSAGSSADTGTDFSGFGGGSSGGAGSSGSW